MPATYLIGIAGPSGAGKSCLAQHLAGALNGTVLETDAYYRDLSHLPPQERVQANFDSPSAIDNELLIAHVAQLAKGQPAAIPIYDFATHTRKSGTRQFWPAHTIIVEGLFTLYWPEMCDLLQTKVYVEMNHHICLERRTLRDVRERGRSVESVHEQYRTTVLPMAEQYVYPTKARADVIVWGDWNTAEQLACVWEHINRRSGGLPVAIESSLPKVGVPNRGKQ